MDKSVASLLDRLRRISPMPEDDLLPVPLINSYQEIVSELAQYRHPDTIRPLIDSFGYGEADGAYWSTLHLLESFPWALVEPELIAAIQAGMSGPSQWAAYMLGRKRSQPAVQFLIGLLQHDKPLVRASAVLALASIGDPAAIEALTALRADPAVEVRNEVRRAIDTLQIQ
ncbi:MAG TPA: HEAT repeat domain-containing protein [Symbiobacteriaceae bacterium]|nr:HEAT repeat domain-containing protein [Symbiobacteriaceae bacterium]